MFGDLDWPLNMLCGLSASAELLYFLAATTTNIVIFILAHPASIAGNLGEPAPELDTILEQEWQRCWWCKAELWNMQCTTSTWIRTVSMYSRMMCLLPKALKASCYARDMEKPVTGRYHPPHHRRATPQTTNLNDRSQVTTFICQINVLIIVLYSEYRMEHDRTSICCLALTESGDRILAAIN